MRIRCEMTACNEIWALFCFTWLQIWAFGGHRRVIWVVKGENGLQVTFCPWSVVLIVFSMQCSPWGPILYRVAYCGLRNHNRVLLLVILIWKIDSWIIREKKGGMLLENLELEGLFVCLCASTKKNLPDFFLSFVLFLLGCLFSLLHKHHINERTGLLIRFHREIIN